MNPDGAAAVGANCLYHHGGDGVEPTPVVVVGHVEEWSLFEGVYCPHLQWRCRVKAASGHVYTVAMERLEVLS